MGFVGSGGNIAIGTALPPSSFVHCIVKINRLWIFSLSFYGCLRLRFLDVETNPGPHRPVPPVCTILCSNMRGLAGNLSDLTVASSQYDILLCSETLVSDMHHVSEVLVPGFCWTVALSCCVVARCFGHVGWLHTFEMVTEYFANPNLSVVVAKCWFFWFLV